jgi:hypothetical protein
VSTVASQKKGDGVDDEKAKIDLAKKQEWDMKKLYAEVFKMSYKQNPLRTQAEQVIFKMPTVVFFYIFILIL